MPSAGVQVGPATKTRSMKAGMVLAVLVSGVAVPTTIEMTTDFDFAPLLMGDANITELAERIAMRDFGTNATLVVKDVRLESTRIGTFGETIKADPGYRFHYARVAVTNTGKMDLAVSTWHFSAEDEIGSDHNAQLANAHDDFDGGRLRVGATREGTVIFHLRESSRITSVVWRGDLAQARGAWGDAPERLGGSSGSGGSQAPSATVEMLVLQATRESTRPDAFGDPVRADPGYAFERVRVRFTNAGDGDVRVSDWQFKAVDDLGSHDAIAGAGEGFDGSLLAPGASVEGTLVFQLHKSSRLAAVEWHGDGAQARAAAP